MFSFGLFCNHFKESDTLTKKLNGIEFSMNSLIIPSMLVWYYTKDTYKVLSDLLEIQKHVIIYQCQIFWEGCLRIP